MTLEVAFRRDPEETLLGLSRLPIISRLPAESQHCAVRTAPSTMYQCRFSPIFFFSLFSLSFFFFFFFFFSSFFKILFVCVLFVVVVVCLFLKGGSYNS